MERNGVFKERNTIYQLLQRTYDMHIALCDDDAQLFKPAKQMLYDYANEHRLELVVDEFLCGEDLLAVEKQEYDIIFLDYQMGELNGIDTAQALRKRNMLSTIIFLTNFSHFWRETYAVGTFRFMDKPLERAHLYDAMDAYFAKFGNDYPLQLRCNRENVTLNTRDIIVVEADRKHCVLYCKNDRTYICSQLMLEVNKQLPTRHFYKVARDFIVNFHYIERHNHEYVWMKNNMHVPISRNCLAGFRNEYRLYTDSQRPESAKAVTFA